MKTNIITAALILCSFALGWCGNGYVIYRDIVGNMAGAVNIGHEK